MNMIAKGLKLISILFCLLIVFSCNSYKGANGINDKGMKNNTTPSQEIHNDYKKKGKKMQRQYDREMKKRKKRMGTSKD